MEDQDRRWVVADRTLGVAHSAELVDVSGRVVAGLRPGENDISALAPGVYFVRECPAAGVSCPSSVGVTKVVISR